MKEHRPGAMDFAVTMMLAHNNPNKYRRSLRTLYGGKNIVNDPDELDDEENAGNNSGNGEKDGTNESFCRDGLRTAGNKSGIDIERAQRGRRTGFGY